MGERDARVVAEPKKGLSAFTSLHLQTLSLPRTFIYRYENVSGVYVRSKLLETPKLLEIPPGPKLSSENFRGELWWYQKLPTARSH